jgi:uncharacterized membrane-anchored protein YhcB (DUF1043 family)
MQASTVTLLIGLAIGIALGFVIATLKSRAANANALGAQAQVKMLTEQLATAQTQQNNTVRLDEVLSDVKARMNTLSKRLKTKDLLPNLQLKLRSNLCE